MQPSEQIADEFVDLVQRFLRLRPKIMFPDERIANLKKQLHSFRDSGVNPEDRMFVFRILDMLRHSEKLPTMGELSAELGIPLSSATRLADGLVHASFVERCPDAYDRRVVRLCITENGRQFIELGANYLRQRVLGLLHHFSAEEQVQLLRLMNKLVDSIETDK